MTTRRTCVSIFVVLFFGETGLAHPLTSFLRYNIILENKFSFRKASLIVFKLAFRYSCRKNPTLPTHALADRLAFSIHIAPLQRRSSRTGALAGASLYRVQCIEPATSGGEPSLCRTRLASASDYEKASRHADRCTDFRHHHLRRHTSAPSAQSSASGAERHRYFHMPTAPRSP